MRFPRVEMEYEEGEYFIFRQHDIEDTEVPWGCDVVRRKVLAARDFEARYRHQQPVLVAAPASGGATASSFTARALLKQHGDTMVTIGHPQSPPLPPVMHQMSRFDDKNPQVQRAGVRRMPLREYLSPSFRTSTYSERDPLYLLTSGLNLSVGSLEDTLPPVPPF
eukprot:COSAG05_NODE_4893_length_1334_cov_1.775709_1_plen_164_part_10